MEAEVFWREVGVVGVESLEVGITCMAFLECVFGDLLQDSSIARVFQILRGQERVSAFELNGTRCTFEPHVQLQYYL